MVIKFLFATVALVAFVYYAATMDISTTEAWLGCFVGYLVGWHWAEALTELLDG